MFNWDNFSEIYHSLKQHKTRNILTGFGVAWGIFILILLLGAGQGLQEGISSLFSSYAQNSIWVYGGQTSQTQKERKAGEQIVFNRELLINLKQRFKEIKFLSPELSHNGNSIVSYQTQQQIGTIKGVGSNYFNIKLLDVENGRTFNPLDFKEQRPVCIIGSNIYKILSKNNVLLGKQINISGNWFKVVGVLAEGSAFNQGEQNAVYVPFTSFQNSFGNKDDFFVFGMLLHDKSESKIFESKLKQFMSRQLHFNTTDDKAIFIANTNQQVKSFNILFSGIKTFLWFIGISVLLSGIIGVGNIMLVIVKERTKEIGIRKAIGANPKSILFMVISEAIIITLSAGLVGLILGVFLIELINFSITQLYHSEELLINSFGVNVPVIIGSVILLVISGALAGLIPAKKAAEVMPVIALNQE